MADRMFHFAVGMALGLALGLPTVVLAWRRRPRLGMLIARLVVLTYAFGLFAVVPGILRYLGVPSRICDGWWMNLFVFHPLVDQTKSGGLLSGVGAVCGLSAFLYGLILLSIVRARRVSRGHFAAFSR